MALFQKKKKVPDVVGREIVGFTKPRRILFFKMKPRPIYKDEASGQGAATVTETQTAQGSRVINVSQGAQQRARGLNGYLSKTIASHKGLSSAMQEAGVKDPIAFAKRTFFVSIILAVVIAIAAYFAMTLVQLAGNIAALMALVLFMAGYFGVYNNLIMAPAKKVKNSGKDIEKDVLFAARDMIISMRSGMPLFNAMATVSDGYGAASKEFGKIIKLVQLGMPISQAIDEVSTKSGSKTFQRLMLQASTSIKVGSDVVQAMQEVISDVSAERVIELRRYGQRLNAIAMFYMLFGVIFPSMGIAVAAIMSTFISIFVINDTTLIFALLGLGFLQFVFLNMITNSRPAFST